VAKFNKTPVVIVKIYWMHQLVEVSCTGSSRRYPVLVPGLTQVWQIRRNTMGLRVCLNLLRRYRMMGPSENEGCVNSLIFVAE
jgi:hypothetical protein